MLKITDTQDRSSSSSSSPSPRPPGPPLLRVVPVGRRSLGAVPGESRLRRGLPHGAEEWTALVKVGSGERDIPAPHCERLLALGLIVTISGVPALTRHGRYTLGLPG